MTYLAVQSRDAPVGTLEGEPNDALSSPHKDAQEGAFEVALKDALQVIRGTLEFTLKAIEDVQEGDKKNTLDV